MMYRMIHENERALVFRNGRLERVLMPGRHRNRLGRVYWVIPLDAEINPAQAASEKNAVQLNTSVALLLKNPDFAIKVEFIELADSEIAAHFVNGRFDKFLSAGVHAFWKDAGEHSIKVFDRSNPEPVVDMPPQLWSKLLSSLYQKVEVAQYQKARLFRDGKLVGVLEPGVYYFWQYGSQVRAEPVDMRLQQLTIIGQELLTQDKVSLRVSFVVNYRVADPVKSMTEVGNFVDQLHVAGQLALREFVASRKMDELLDSRDELSGFVVERLKELAKQLYVEVFDAGVKDITLPGNIRDIMNTVLIAEKRAQANVIARREEVASTRSLLNTAKLMDENKTLYKLKELETLERIVEKVGSITVSGSGDLLSQLSGILGSR